MSNTALPPVRLEPGWYWYHFIREIGEKPWEAFRAANAGALKLRSVFAGEATTPLMTSLFGGSTPNWVPSPLPEPPPSMVVVFELVAPLAWTLSGVPSKAPKKAATTLKDIASSEAVKQSPSLQKLVTDAVGNTGSALTLLVWGGAAVLLFNLYRSTRPAPEPAPEFAAEEA